ncbi:hypothetical protein BU23DRAFT_453675 [Bimuria novae-zelandiae CBS 107.79]|uniref:Uncharacterized protein n=1 Tax=Bimuria novae-zelandiae CBS 107.79 TaxID=1447943 RepID=A0A6A5VIQ0_9PLEO|nr:hypothetical protein BU23DRAFT_453675 [Bimuria novae-zelandiae CBS 107.79]
MLARLMSDLTARSLPNHGVLELLIPYVEGHKSFHSISNLLERLVTNKTKLSSTTFLESYTDLLLEEISTESEITRLGYNLASFNRLLNAQLALGVADVHTKARFEAIRSHRLFCHILARANDASVVPLAYRNLTANIPKEVQADLVHQFAFQYATDRTRSIQQNWRSIRYLYFYLRIHDMAIRPLFTRTVVSVCITRPLAEKRFVAQKKAVWVCRLVAEVEGEAAARHVEQYFWAWRGDLILQARRELVRLGVYDLARVTTMERLKLLTVVPKRTPECEEDVDTHGHGLAEDRC